MSETRPPPPDLLIFTLAGLFAGVRSLAIGANSPIPAAAALIAQRRDPAMVVSIQGSAAHDIFTGGGVEQFDFVAQGRLDAFVIGGAQIDGRGNLNLVAAGDYARPTARYPGSFGSAFVYFLVPKVIIFREAHDPRVLVPQVDFVSAPGWSPAEVHRPGGPSHLLTSRALFAFDRQQGRFRLDSIHPGNSLDDIRALTGFDFDLAPKVATTPVPSDADRELLHGPIRSALADIYPNFVKSRLDGARSTRPVGHTD